jgi:hypothetical protein
MNLGRVGRLFDSFHPQKIVSYLYRDDYLLGHPNSVLVIATYRVIDTSALVLVSQKKFRFTPFQYGRITVVTRVVLIYGASQSKQNCLTYGSFSDVKKKKKKLLGGGGAVPSWAQVPTSQFTFCFF